MSTDSLTAGPAQSARPSAAAPAMSWLRFFRSELRLVFGRWRNLAMLAVVVILPIAFGVLFRLTINSGSGNTGGGGPAFLNQLAGNGVFLALVVLTFMLLLLLPLVTAVISGDSIAGEAGLGTLRGLLTVPAGRTRLLTVKYAVIVTFSLVSCLLVAGVSLVMGLLLFPTGPVTTLSGTTISLGSGVLRVLVIALYSIGAMAALLILVIGSEIADQVPQLSGIHPYLPTHFWSSWDGLFRDPVDVSGMQHGLLSFLVYFVIFGGIAWARLNSADVTS
jgi:ABC-2 type transport system permease protein